VFCSSKNLKPFVFTALEALIHKNPILSAIPVNEDSNHPYFARLPEINLEDTVLFVARQLPVDENEVRDIELDSILEAQHNRGFKENYGKLPFWRLIILISPHFSKEFTASFVFHHSLGEGTAGMIFHKNFLAAISAYPAPLPLTSTIVYPLKRNLLPTLEQLLPSTTAPLTSNPHQAHKSPWTGNKIILSTTNSSKFRSLILPQPLSSGLLIACRANGATLTSTLPVLIAVALTKTLSTLDSEFEELECTIPVSLRRFLPQSTEEDKDKMGVWMDAFSQYYHRENVLKFSWEEARRSRETITQHLASGAREMNVAKLKLISDMREFFRSKIEEERTSSFDVSNVGNATGRGMSERGETRGWEMGRMVFSRSAFVIGSAINTGVVSGPDGCLVLGCCWQDGVVSEGLVDAVMKGVSEGVGDIAEKV
jgi:hypothetical protein